MNNSSKIPVHIEIEVNSNSRRKKSDIISCIRDKVNSNSYFIIFL